MKEKNIRWLILVLVFLLGLDLGFIVCNVIDGKNISADGLLSFLGAILGGTIAAISIYTTIKRANEEVREKEIKDVRPFIVFKPEFNNNFMESYNADEDFCHYAIASTIENVSDNLVNDLRLLDEDVYIYNEGKLNKLKPNATNYEIYTVLLDSREMVKAHDKFSFHTNFLIDNYMTVSESSAACFKIVTRYTYRDILDLVEYTHYCEYELNINYTSDHKYNLFYTNLVNRTESYKNLKTGEIVKL